MARLHHMCQCLWSGYELIASLALVGYMCSRKVGVVLLTLRNEKCNNLKELGWDGKSL